MTSNTLYQTQAINTDGVDGYSYVDRKEGMRVIVSNPLNDAPGTNPEELLGLSLSTCFNATIHSVLKDKDLYNQSRVTVPVQLKKEQNQPGYYFKVEVHAAIDGLAPEEAKQIVEIARKRCPVYKLLKESQTVTVKTISYS